MNRDINTNANTGDIEKAIGILATRIKTDTKSDDAMRYAQAALSFAHVLQVQAQTKKT